MQSVEEIYRKYAQTVYQYLLSLTHDPHVAEEVTQETFYQAIKSIDRYDGSSKITTWLCAIAKNCLSSYRRKHPVMEPWDLQPDDEGEGDRRERSEDATDSAEQIALQKREQITLMKQLHLLKEPYREILYLRIFGDLSFKEIGEVLGKTENWARVSYYRGKEMLRKELTDYEI